MENFDYSDNSTIVTKLVITEIIIAKLIITEIILIILFLGALYSQLHYNKPLH